MREPSHQSIVHATSAVESDGGSCYVYGALAAHDAARRAASAADGSVPMTARTYEDVGVLACAVDARDRLAIRQLALTHDAVLSDLASHCVILPATPGTIAGAAQLDGWLARSAPLLRELLADVAGRVEVDVTAQWSLHALMRGDERWRMDDGRATPPRYLARRRQRDGERRVAAAVRAEVSRHVLGAIASAGMVVQRAPAATERLDVACCVRRDRLGALDAALEQATLAMAGEVVVKRGAPRPPYAFAALHLAPIGSAERRPDVRRAGRAS